MRAMVEQAPFAIAINIQNAPGSSGRVINNRSGGHWYRMVGPARGIRNIAGTASQYTGVGRSLLIAYPGSADVPEVPVLIVAGHGMYAWGADVPAARRHLEIAEWLLRFAVATR